MAKKGQMNEYLRKPEVLTEIGGCIASGMNWEALRRHLKGKYSIESTTKTIKKVYNTYIERRAEVIGGKKDLAKKIETEVEETIINTRDSLTKIHKFVDGLMDRTRGLDDHLALEASREILRQLSFQERLLNRLQTGRAEEGQISKIEITQIVINKLDELEKSGRIKVIDVTLVDRDRTEE